jgi:hypothetical protein
LHRGELFNNETAAVAATPRTRETAILSIEPSP